MITEKNQTPQLPQTDVKCRFFAQYWGQKVMKKNIKGLENFYSEPDGFIRSMTIDSNLFLELKPLSKITKKDLEKIGFGNIGNKKVTFNFQNYNYCWSSSCGMYGTLILKHIDYLRSKGYALPYMEYSVEDLVSFGWVRLG